MKEIVVNPGAAVARKLNVNTKKFDFMIRPATANDYSRVCDLLQSENLPTIDLPRDLPYFFVKTDSEEIVGTVGLELYGGAALLRSMMVLPSYRNKGIASQLVDELTLKAKKESVHSIFLITNTAEDFFNRKGFRKIERRSVDEWVLQSQEFNGLCPASSAVMMKEI